MLKINVANFEGEKRNEKDKNDFLEDTENNREN